MKCSLNNCPGEYESRAIVHTVRHQGRVIVFENVPAEVCDTCGDILLSPDTVRRIEYMLEHLSHPDRTAPVYRFAG